MSRTADDDRPKPDVAAAWTGRSASVPPPTASRTLVWACVPAVLLGMAIRGWVIRTPWTALNSDEAFTGLQAYGVLRGHLAFVPGGNDYGATTEAYLLAPLLTMWGGPGPLRLVALLLSVVVAGALFWLAVPFLGRVGAAVIALIGWTMSGAIVRLWSVLYMGYSTGLIAQICAIGLATRAIRTPDRLRRTAALAGLSAGLSLWSHPMFGAVAGIALLPACWCRRRQVRTWWLPVVAGGMVGMSGWMVHIATHGWPRAAAAGSTTTYPGRVAAFFTELLPRVLGLHTPATGWVQPAALTIPLSGVAIAASLGGLLLLRKRAGPPANPLLLTGALIFPVLALLPPLGYFNDARYGLPFLPTLLMGLGALLMLLPDPLRRSPWLIVVVPTVWAVGTVVPVVHHYVGWQLTDPDTDSREVARTLELRGMHYLGGDYWATYLTDYLAGGRLVTGSTGTVRLPDEAQQVTRADPLLVAYVYPHGSAPDLPLPPTTYHLERVGRYDVYLPASPD